MNINNKIVICGPPGTGKTTLTNVFFRKGNPLKLLQKSLEPTRGVKSGIFSLFNSQLGVFDLAGQENKNWFSSDKEIFEKSDVILCVFDINNSIETIISFLVDLLKIRKKSHSLSDCSIITLLHKIDLVSSSYLSQKVEVIRSFFKSHYRLGNTVDIHTTSISKDFFYKTYKIMMDILNLAFKRNFIPISSKKFEYLKKELLIIIRTECFVKYELNNLIYKFNMSKDSLLKHMKRLKKIGFTEFLDGNNIVQFTKRCEFFRKGLLREVKKIDEMRENHDAQLFYTFQELYNTTLIQEI